MISLILLFNCQINNLRKQLSGISVNSVKFSADILAEVFHCLLNVSLTGKSCSLILILPSLNINDRQTSVQRILEILQQTKTKLFLDGFQDCWKNWYLNLGFRFYGCETECYDYYVIQAQTTKIYQKKKYCQNVIKL